ncbi:thioredoxin domain-containing protein [Stieleria marina]|uniref:thioredoxin domain-containing protein n=1 Tax=Stieleria marina TaxID=1930275 RepID=UPI003AF33754
MSLFVLGADAPSARGQDEPASPDKPSAVQTAQSSSIPVAESGGDHTTAKHEHTNRLAKESSPYLLQHAHNPVDWYPWGDEAFAKAKRENKMVFLSVGYAACHWCHVMERESFEDAEIAKLMNDKFVCIKVDREERPDVDQIYMTSVQMISGSGGWPMSVFLLPDAKPFWGGTYFPARTGDRGTSTGFLSIVKQIDQAWKTQNEVVRKQAQHVTQAIAANQLSPDDEATPQPGGISDAMIDRVADSLAKAFDPKYGGFGYSEARDNQPKFPEPSNLVFLLDRMKRQSVASESREQAKAMVRKTLDGMLSGAMLDHLGGGFHRYSVDRKWQIPHFEKMLYDNGQLASVYAQAGVDFDSPEYRDVARQICDFVLRELKADGNAFYSALDADSDGEEGKFYRWTQAEVADMQSSVEGFANFATVFRLTAEPNFEGEYFAIDPRRSLTSIADERGTTYDELRKQLAPARSDLFRRRSTRSRPLTDVKILTAWNGLMIAGLADTGRLLHEPKYVRAAADAAEFVLRELADSDGRLKRSYAAGQAKLNAYVDDYAFLVSGLIALHRATDDVKWLTQANAITEQQIQWFGDDSGGGFFFTSSDHPSLIVRVKDPVDGAIPSGASVSAENLLYLLCHQPQPKFATKLMQTLNASAPLFRKSPSAAPRLAAVAAEFNDSKSNLQGDPASSGNSPLKSRPN